MQQRGAGVQCAAQRRGVQQCISTTSQCTSPVSQQLIHSSIDAASISRRRRARLPRCLMRHERYSYYRHRRCFISSACSRTRRRERLLLSDDRDQRANRARHSNARAADFHTAPCPVGHEPNCRTSRQNTITCSSVEVNHLSFNHENCREECVVRRQAAGARCAQ